MDEFLKIPPITRFLVTSTLVVSVGPLLNLVSAYTFLLWWPKIFRGQVWRLITSFFLTGGGLQVVFDLFLLGRNAMDLEVNHFTRSTSRFAWALIVIGGLILATNHPLGATTFFRPMLMALTYLWSRVNANSSVSLFGLVSCPAPLLPYAYLLFDVLAGGAPLAIHASTGIFSAHIYYYLTHIRPEQTRGRNMIPPPAFLARLLPDSVDPATATQQAARDAPGGRGGTVRSTDWGGTAFAPRGRSFGDGASGVWGGSAQGSSASARGNTIGDGDSTTARQPFTATGGSGAGAGAGAGAGMGWFSSFFGGGGGGASSSSGSSASASASAARQRQAMLEATERRLRANRDGSIAGRNAAASSSASPKPQPAGSSAATGKQPSTTGYDSGSSIQGLRSRNINGSSSAGNSTAANATSSRDQGNIRRLRHDDPDENLDASSSGGAVAEDRSHLDGRSKKDESGSGSSGGGFTFGSGAEGAGAKKKDKDGGGDVGHQWGQGRRLGE